ncbi:Transient receptor potential cation channel subfamily M member 5 [Galemys pyrenaicus]|uniref:Transient receptor potential cation channel subfamily M member 5 n=1 Tax=Galemys pyrenaicus TaxID=202257 RepID=A0A8J6DVQ6_GALPY|nr:Transient receptor potential cation channel subfamily M member 5 [Galemys pyrenaicus]
MRALACPRPLHLQDESPRDLCAHLHTHTYTPLGHTPQAPRQGQAQLGSVARGALAMPGGAPPSAQGPEMGPHLEAAEGPMRAAQGAGPQRPGEAGAGQGPSLHRGEIDFGACGKKRGKFVKVPSSVAPAALFDLLLAEWHLPAPSLVVSLVGEERPLAVKARLRDVLRKGLVKAAQSTGAWILTSALRTGLARHVGRAVRDHSLACTSAKSRVVTIGMASLGHVLHRQLLDKAQEDSLVQYPADSGSGQGPLCPLDNSHSHFILVEPGPPGTGDGATELRLSLERYISQQRTSYGGTSSIEIPVLCLLVNGDPGSLERMSRALAHTAPWLVLAGSGGVADVLAALVSQPHLLVPQVAEKQFREKFPGEQFSWADVVHWTELLRTIAAQQHLLTVHDLEQEGSEELETVILKALLKACKSRSQDAQDYLDELKLAVAWDRVDIARSEIFNGDVDWKSRHLEEVLMDALVGNKPEFVRLFVDNGADVADFLTYGRLQRLYHAVAPKSLLFGLLQRKHEEGRLTLAGLGAQQPREPPSGQPAFSLHDVSRLLKDFLHDACRGFYQEKGPARRPAGQKWLLDLGQKSEHPWRDLFLWAVLQGRHEMATYFWAMGQEGVAAALAACRILKEMAHLEPQAQAGSALCEAKYEQLALGECARAQAGAAKGGTAPPVGRAEPASRRGKGRAGTAGTPGSVAGSLPAAAGLFSECFSNNQDRAFALLVRHNRSWSRTTCLHLATEADAKAFFAHDGVQAFLTKIWWGDMASGTPILRLLGAFLCPALVYTNLITFSGPGLGGGGSAGPEAACARSEEAPLRTGPEDLQELDSLDTETSLLCAPGMKEPAQEPGVQGPPGPRVAFLLTRWRKFWGAPVTVFLGNVAMYFAFLFLFAYVLLADFRPPPLGPSGPEVALYFWVFTLVLEEIRQGFFAVEDPGLVKKLAPYVRDNWNKCDVAAVSLFAVGVVCRMLPSAFEAGRAVLAVDFMVFALRLIHIFAIHKQLGPKIIIVERMMKDVFFFLFFLSVWLVAYGVTTQALLHPQDSRPEWIFRRVLYRPYLQIFGQIPLDEIDGHSGAHALAPPPAEARVNCSAHPLQLEDTPSCPNLYANWLVILLLVAFLLVTNVLLMNLLIAMFSYTFQVVQGNADTFWKFQRYHLIVEYYERPALAPPFILFSHLSLVLKRALQKGAPQKRARLGERGRPRGRPAGRWGSDWGTPRKPAVALPPDWDLPVPLDQRVAAWEEVQKEEFLSRLEAHRKDSQGELLRRAAHRVDSVAKYLGALREQDKRTRRLESQVTYCTVLLSSMADSLAQGVAHQANCPSHQTLAAPVPGARRPLQTTVLAGGSTPKLASCLRHPTPQTASRAPSPDVAGRWGAAECGLRFRQKKPRLGDLPGNPGPASTAPRPPDPPPGASSPRDPA